MNSKERLAKAMEDAACPPGLIERAKAGEFDDFESPHATPCIQLVRELSQLGFLVLAKRAMNGEFDGTKEYER